MFGKCRCTKTSGLLLEATTIPSTATRTPTRKKRHELEYVEDKIDRISSEMYRFKREMKDTMVRFVCGARATCSLSASAGRGQRGKKNETTVEGEGGHGKQQRRHRVTPVHTPVVRRVARSHCAFCNARAHVRTRFQKEGCRALL